MPRKKGPKANFKQSISKLHTLVQEEVNYDEQFSESLSLDEQSSFTKNNQSEFSQCSEQGKQGPKILKMFESLNEQNEVFEKLKSITEDFNLTYTKIKEKQMLDQPPLKFLKKHDVQYLLRFWRQKNKREGTKILNQIRQENKALLFNRKQILANDDSEYIEGKKNKRQKTDSLLVFEKQEKSLARVVISNFESFEKDEKEKILGALDNILKTDSDLFAKATNNQIKAYIKEACQFYETHQQKQLLQLLNKLSPMAAILLNIEISLTNNLYTEEGNTLSQTLLPYLNQQCDYNFIQNSAHFILNRFLNSLIKHIQDTKIDVSMGFMSYVLFLDAQKTQEIIHSEQNKVALQQALFYKGFSQKACSIFLSHPKQLLWPLVISYLQVQEDHKILENILIISKLRIINDPGHHLIKINNIFAQRKIIVDMLIKQKKIDITIEKFIIVLENLVLLKTETIKQCLESDAKYWNKISSQQVNQEIIIQDEIHNKSLIEIYNTLTDDILDKVSLDDINNISQSFSQNFNHYRHNPYQCAITAILASQTDTFVISVIPTGQGKTFIQALLAKYFCLKKKKVTILEPNEILQFQTTEKISGIDYGITVATPEWYYQYKPKEDILIIDEYDDIVNNFSYYLVNNVINGIWTLKGKKVFAFSATSNNALEKLINNTIERPKVLKFQSQYEIVNGVSHLQLGNIYTTESQEQLDKQIKNDILKFFDQRPIIIILNKAQIEGIKKLLIEENFRFLIGANENNIQEIRSWDYGILVLTEKEARGLDTRFQKDSIVLIIAEVKNELQYQQFIGRSSRHLGVSEGTLYCLSKETSSQIMSRLNKQNFTQYQQLEYLLKLIQQKTTNQHIIEAIIKSEQKQEIILSLEQLQNYMSGRNYQQLLKNISL